METSIWTTIDDSHHQLLPPGSMAPAPAAAPRALLGTARSRGLRGRKAHEKQGVSMELVLSWWSNGILWWFTAISCHNDYHVNEDVSPILPRKRRWTPGIFHGVLMVFTGTWLEHIYVYICICIYIDTYIYTYIDQWSIPFGVIKDGTSSQKWRYWKWGSLGNDALLWKQ